jgi:hypothetical protein
MDTPTLLGLFGLGGMGSLWLTVPLF